MAADCRWCLSYRLQAGPHVENRVLVEVVEVVWCAQRGLLRHAAAVSRQRREKPTRPAVLGVHPAIF